MSIATRPISPVTLVTADSAGRTAVARREPAPVRILLVRVMAARLRQVQPALRRATRGQQAMAIPPAWQAATRGLPEAQRRLLERAALPEAPVRRARLVSLEAPVRLALLISPEAPVRLARQALLRGLPTRVVAVRLELRALLAQPAPLAQAALVLPAASSSPLGSKTGLFVRSCCG